MLYSPYKLFALVETAKSFGISPNKVLKETDLDYGMLQQGTTQTTVEQYLTACSNVIRLHPGSQLPLEVGKSLHLSAYGLYGFALLCSPSVRSGFEFAVRYHQLATPIFEIRWEIRDEAFVWTFPDEGRVGYPRLLKTFLLVQQLSQHVTHVKDIARADRKPAMIRATIEPPEPASFFEDVFGCPVMFGARATEIEYDMSILDDRPPLTNPITYAMLRESCEGLIGAIYDKTGIAGQVSRIFMEHAAPFPSMEDVAAKLAMTSRTLRRRLNQEGVSFSGLLDEVRNKLAKKYLDSSSFTVDDITELLGFSDTANFRSSFKRWNGVTPSAYRSGAY